MNPKNLQSQSRLVLLVLTACIIWAAAQPTIELPPDGKSPGSSDPTLQHCEVPWSRSSNNNDIIIDIDTNETSSTPVDSSYNFITTNFGTKVANTDTSLKAGPRGPTLMEDFHFREKLTHFDHERIPERVVHARGFGAHGYFQVYEPLADLTSASFLQDPSKKTPVFVRFSTVLGSRGSADTVRDVRGFATKFYTDSGNFDLVGNDIPVFFIQDAIKFPDLIHSAKPEPHHDIPQAATAHDNFWDFVSLVPQTLHTVMWVLSDRGIPRSFRMMPGFGVNTFVLVNGTGHRKFVKFHWLPVLGVHSLVWDEAQQLAGIDSDFHRRDLWEAIANGQYPEWELGLQIVDESDEDSFDFDLLDATKIIPEESVPVIRVGRMVLNRNVDNFFDETEQVAFHVGHLVPGIEPSHDPLFQGRLFSYIDTQLIRLGGPNFEQIPINQPVAPVLNNQRQGYHRIIRDKGTVNYYPNRFGCPMLASIQQGAYEFRSIGLSGVKTRDTGPKFFEYFNQSRLFYNSLTGWEKQHLTDAAIFELGNVEDFGVRSRVVNLFKQVDCQLAEAVAKGIGVPSPLASGNTTCRTDDIQSPSLSQNNTVKNTILSRRLAILVGEGYNYQQLWWMSSFLTGNGAMPFVVGPVKGPIASNNGGEDDQGTENVQMVNATFSFVTAKSVMFDGVVVVGGQASIDFLSRTGNAKRFVTEAFKHGKPIVGLAEGVDFISDLPITVSISPDQAQHEIMGVVTWRGFGASNSTGRTQFANTVFTAIAAHRHPEREVASVP